MDGIQIELDERKRPTPAEWRFFTRQELRHARQEMKAMLEKQRPFVDWGRVGFNLRKCLKRLEDPAYDGQGLELPGGEDLTIADVGQAGYDISAKSYEWRTGYFEVLMSLATTAEHMDSMVLDRARKRIFPRMCMIGPSNPDPRPTPSYMASAPKEEDCEKAFKPPEEFYMKILTGRGFTTRQRMEAAEGYANWLEFQGAEGSAEEMLRWGVDIARSGSVVTMAEDAVVADGGKMGATGKGAKGSQDEALTANILRARTTLATYHARTGDVASALPIFLSVLRARRTAPIAPLQLASPQSSTASSNSATTDIGAAINFVARILRPPQFPPPPPSGDTAFVRVSEKPTCEEAELMLYIGEIMFAAQGGAGGRGEMEGIGWTRQSVRIAEVNVQSGAAGAEEGEEGDRRCKECLLTGVGNWETMLRRLSVQQSSASSREGGRNAGLLEWRGWFGGDGGVKGKVMDEAGARVVEAELRQVEALKESIMREGIDAEMMALQRGQAGSGGLWIG